MTLATPASLLHPLAAVDPEIAEAIANEEARQADGLELIASENFVSRAILEAQGSVLTNKYAEGYPGKRYYGGCEFVDVAESLAIARAKALFGADHANVQPHSGAQANLAVYFAAVKPGDTVLGMNLAHGGHLTHGHPLNYSGQLYRIVPYGVRPDDERIDYEELERLAHAHKPKMIVVGASAYPRIIDFARIHARGAGRRLHRDGGHGAHRGARGHRAPPQPRALRRLRHLHHPQDASRAPRGAHPLPRGAREGSGSRGVPRRAGRAVDARRGRQGRLLQAGDGARRSRNTRSGSWPTRRAWRRRSSAMGSAWSAAAPTTI